MSLKQKIENRRIRPEDLGELTDKTVFINRVAKVVKGGRRFSFSALVVTGDGKGHVGFALGKAQEVPDAIRKASDRARKNLIRVPLKGSTIPHDFVGKYGPTSVVMKPAKPGTGIIAGSVVRSIVEAVGIKDIRTKCIGSNNAQNVLQATMAGLIALREPNRIASMRGIALEELNYSPY